MKSLQTPKVCLQANLRCRHSRAGNGCRARNVSRALHAAGLRETCGTRHAKTAAMSTRASRGGRVSVGWRMWSLAPVAGQTSARTAWCAIPPSIAHLFVGLGLRPQHQPLWYGAVWTGLRPQQPTTSLEIHGRLGSRACGDKLGFLADRGASGTRSQVLRTL